MSNPKSKKKVVFFGELLMRLAPMGFERFVQARNLECSYTGAEANVAVSLCNYGIESYMVSSVPDHEIGHACINFLRQYGVNVDFVTLCGRRLGIFYLEKGASQRPSKVIYDRTGTSITDLNPHNIEWSEILEGKDWFHFSGTAPALGDNVAQIVYDACATAHRMGLTVSCDLNYRKKLWTTEKARTVMSRLMDNIDVVVGNEEDTEKVFKIKAKGSDVAMGKLDVIKYEDVAKEMMRRFSIRTVAITLRESISASENIWSGMLYDGKQSYFSRKFPIHMVDRVGSGDSFSAGIIFGILNSLEPDVTLEFAVAASCLKHTIPGDLNLVSLNEVYSLMQGDVSGRVQR
jgi:2-dehydro-3-deoxygluconokinase